MWVAVVEGRVMEEGLRQMLQVGGAREAGWVVSTVLQGGFLAIGPSVEAAEAAVNAGFLLADELFLRVAK